VNNQALLSEMRAVVGAENIAPQEAARSVVPAWWSNEPLAVIAPGSTEKIVRAVRVAEAAQTAILPYGGGTQWETGAAPRADKPFLLLKTTRLQRVLDYQPDDLTVTCEPGVTLAQLQQTLAERRQFLAVDVPLPERATLGGIVAANTSGFWRPAYGTPRDLVIGLRAVMTEGTAVKAGGKVVKNVAGYDLCKLFTGSWGTLGVITEITFKVRTRPEAERALAWNAPDTASAARIGFALYRAPLSVTYVLATNEPYGTPRLIAGLQGSPARLDWQAAELTRLAAEAGLSAAPETLPDADIADLRDRQARLGPGTAAAARIACLPTDQAALVQAFEAIPGLRLTVHCGNGILALAATKPEASLVQTVTAQTPANAHLVWTRLHENVTDRSGIAVWGEPREDFKLHRALKQALDPQDTFSPGRFFGNL
jgi:glycolate oxidase FAD binding subunit